jgi:hypothetical protein
MIKSAEISFEFSECMIESRWSLGHCRGLTGQKKSNRSSPASLKVFLYREKRARSCSFYSWLNRYCMLNFFWVSAIYAFLFKDDVVWFWMWEHSKKKGILLLSETLLGFPSHLKTVFGVSEPFGNPKRVSDSNKIPFFLEWRSTIQITLFSYKRLISRKANQFKFYEVSSVIFFLSY